MSNSCIKCGGLILKLNITYGYAGPICYCSIIPYQKLPTIPPRDYPAEIEELKKIVDYLQKKNILLQEQYNATQDLRRVGRIMTHINRALDEATKNGIKLGILQCEEIALMAASKVAGNSDQFFGARSVYHKIREAYDVLNNPPNKPDKAQEDV